MRKIGLSVLMLFLFIPFPASAQGNDAQFVFSIVRVINLPEPYCWATGVAIGNLTNDPGNEVVIGGGTDYSVYPVIGKIFAFDPNDQIIWTRTAPAEEYVMGVDIGDVDDDNDNEIVAGYTYRLIGLPGQKSRAELVDHEGNLIWGYDMSQHSNYTRIARIGNVTDHPGNEIFLGSNLGWAALLNSSGGLIWEREIGGVINLQSARIADIDNDGQNEIVPAGGWGPYGDVRALDKNGNEKWRVSLCREALGVGIGEIDQQSPGLEIVVPCAARKDAAGNPFGSNNVSLVSSQGTILWQIPYHVQVWSAATGDIDGDGINEILIGYGNHDVAPPSENESGGVAALDKEGNVIADLRLPSSVKNLEFGDANNDGKNEILASCDCGRAYVIAAVPKPDLVAYYTLENSFADSSLYQNHGTAYGNPVFEAGRFGIGLRLDGVDDYIQTDANNALDSSNAGTVTAWIKTSASSAQAIVSYTTSSVMSSSYVWRVRNNVLEMAWNFAGAGGNWNLINGTTPVNDGEWHFVAFVSDGLSRNKIYLDGVEQTTVFTSTGSSTNDRGWTDNIDGAGSYDHHINLGGLNRGVSPVNWFNGTIDHVRIWQKAITSDEIRGQLADLNGDGNVDISDLALIANNFGKDSNFDTILDTDSNGKIDIFDIIFVASRFV